MKDINVLAALYRFYFPETLYLCFIALKGSQWETQLIIENERQFVIAKGKGLGTSNPIKISLYDHLKVYPKADKDSYEARYQKGQITEKWQRVSLFKFRFN